MTIDMTRVRHVLEEVHDIVDELDGIDLDETDAVTSQSKGDARRLKAQKSQDLQMLANRLELAAALVRIEYWAARGQGDPLADD